MRVLVRAIGAMALCMLSACGSDDEGSSPSGTGGSAGTGNPRTQAAAFAREDIKCTQDSDCCVVFDGCTAEGYVVGATDQSAVRTLLTSAPADMCVNCIPPAVQVSCGPNGTCIGQKIQCTDGLLEDAIKDHCGKVTLETGCTVKTQDLQPWDPGLQVETILGCGE